MSVLAIHHVNLTIPPGAEESARHFYRDLLGLVEVGKPEPLRSRGGLWLQLGSLQVHLSVQDGVDRRASRAHVAFQVNDLDGLSSALADRGLQPSARTPVLGMRRIQVRDPFGNLLEFMQTDPTLDGER